MKTKEIFYKNSNLHLNFTDMLTKELVNNQIKDMPTTPLLNRT